MPKVIISDTSCFILLTTIDHINLLYDLYGDVYTTPEVVLEFGTSLPNWVIPISSSNQDQKEFLKLQLDEGEASAIALALEMPDCTIILDDTKARKFAKDLGPSVTGTLGVIIKAKLEGLIPSIKPILSKIKTTNFYISDSLIEKSIQEAEEDEEFTN